MPDAWMDGEASIAAETKADEVLGPDVVTRQGERHEKRLVLEWKEQLATVRVIVGVPQQHPLGRALMFLFRALRVSRVREHIASAHRIVSPEQNITLPFAYEHAFGRAGLVAGVLVDGTPPLPGPAHDLDRAILHTGHRASECAERFVARLDHRHEVPAQPGRNAGVHEVKDRAHP